MLPLYIQIVIVFHVFLYFIVILHLLTCEQKAPLILLYHICAIMPCL